MKPHTYQVTLRLTEEQADLVRAIAQMNDVPFAVTARKLLNDKLEAMARSVQAQPALRSA